MKKEIRLLVVFLVFILTFSSNSFGQVSLENGNTFYDFFQFKEAIKDVGETRKNQSMTIARTETGTISGATRYQAFRIEGIEYTEWLTANDEKVRDSHVVAGNSGPIAVGGLFPAVNMRYPLDPQGMPGDIINCRCVSIPAKRARE